MKFSSLFIRDWRQFEEVEIDFHPNVTIIAGANGSGKSTLLSALSRHYCWMPPLLATPKLSKDGAVQYIMGWFGWLSGKVEQPARQTVGSIVYSDHQRVELFVNKSQGVLYELEMAGRPQIDGVHIGSHRPMPTYQQVTNIPTNAINAAAAYQQYHNELIVRNQNSHSGSSPTHRMKESLISMAMFGPGNSYVQPNAAIGRLFEEFKDVLAKILPKQIGFRDISIRVPDVVIVTDTGEFLLDASSGGLMSLVDLAWQIFLYAQNRSEFVVTFDEPENHLHPSMQRSLIGQLVNAFPRAQFIIATHSPFIVSSVRDSNVYALQHSRVSGQTAIEGGVRSRVRSVKLDRGKAGTASEILRDVLGVPVTMPEWAESDLREICSHFEGANLSKEAIADLRTKLAKAGLGEFYPDALLQIATKQ